MKKTSKKLMLTSALVSVCGCFALVACGDDTTTPPKSTPLATPTGLSVSVKTLSWGEVAGATNGYTVMVNSKDDQTKTVDTNELDLDTVVTWLVDGDNSLQVKANAAGGKKESAYSAAYTYEYHAQPPQKTPFAKVTIKLSGDIVSWQAVTGATNGYTVKVNTQTTDVTTNEVNLLTNTEVNGLLLANKDNDISVMVKAAGNNTDSEYSNTVTYKYEVSADKAAKDFIAAVNAIGTVSLDKADRITLAKGKYDAIKEDSEALAVDGVSAALTKLKQADCGYFALLVSGIKAVDEDSAVAAYTELETKHAAALEYYGKLLDNTAAAGAKQALDSIKGNYDLLVEQTKDAVDDLADEVDALLAVDYTEQVPTKQDLTNLDGKADAITALKPYAAAYWAEEYAEKATGIADKKTEILAIAIAEKTVKVQSPVVYNHQNQDATNPVSYMYIVRKYYNVLDEVITETTLPTVTAKGATVTAPTAANAKGEFVWKLTFATPEADTPVEIAYTVGGEKEIPVNIECLRDASIYNVVVDGSLKFQRGETDHSYMNVYDSSLVTKGTVGGEKDIIISGAPVITGYQVNDSKLTEDALKSLLAKAGLRGEQNVTIVMYNMKTVEVSDGEDEDGNEITKIVTQYSAINETGIATFSCTLTDDDVLVRIPFNHEQGALSTTEDGGFICGAAINFAEIATAFGLSEDDARAQIRFHVTVYKDGVEKGDFYAAVPGNGILNGATMKRNVYRFCGTTATSDNITYTVSIALAANSDYDDVLRESLTSPQKDWKQKNDQGEVLKEFTATAEDARFTGGTLNNVAIGNTEATDGNIAYGDYQWANDNNGQYFEEYFHAYHDGLALLVFDATDVENPETYDFVAQGVKPFAVYTHTTWSEIAWSAVNAEIDKAWAKLPAAQKKNTMKFVFATQVIANDDGKEMGFLDSVPHYFVDNTDATKYAVVTYNRNFAIPTYNQIRVTDNGFIIFLEKQGTTTEERTDYIYNQMYGVQYIEVKITINGNDYLAYIMLDDEYRGNNETENWREMAMYISTDKSGTRLGLDYASNGWCLYSAFVNFVNANKAYFGLEGAGDDGEDLVFTDTDAVEFRTKIVHDGSYFNNESDYSDPVGKNNG